MLKNAPIIIMDEATSALDSETEEFVQENINKLFEKNTCITIAHRQSTIKGMDRMLTIEGGFLT